MRIGFYGDSFVHEMRNIHSVYYNYTTYLTKITGETWTPAEVQETIWSWAKTLYETAGAKGEKRARGQGMAASRVGACALMIFLL